MRVFGYSLLFILLLSIPLLLFSQKELKKYNTDSLIETLSENILIKRTIEEAATIYKTANINPENISPHAFQIAYLEKTLLDSNLIIITPKWKKWYCKKNILTIVDFTKTANKNRFCTVDLKNSTILFDTLVSHGSANGLNNIEDTPRFFGNTHESNRNSLGLIVTRQGTQPINPGHFCKYILTEPHDCSMFLSGLELTINDQIRKRAIVMHTTGSRNFCDSLIQIRLKEISKEYEIDSTYVLDEKRLVCYSKFSRKNGTPSYAAEDYIKKANSFIGRSLGCLVLPEESHSNIINTIKDGALIFTYSNIITPGSTNYFEESPVIKQIIAFVNKEKILIAKTNKP